MSPLSAFELKEGGLHAAAPSVQIEPLFANALSVAVVLKTALLLSLLKPPLQFMVFNLRSQHVISGDLFDFHANLPPIHHVLDAVSVVLPIPEVARVNQSAILFTFPYTDVP